MYLELFIIQEIFTLIIYDNIDFDKQIFLHICSITSFAIIGNNRIITHFTEIM